MQTLKNNFFYFLIFSTLCCYLTSCGEEKNDDNQKSNDTKQVEKKESTQDLEKQENDHSNHDHGNHVTKNAENAEKNNNENKKNKEIKATANDDSDHVIKIKTNKGDIDVILYDDTPLHKKNFLDLVNKKMYDGQIFHRVIKDFMIQGGGIDMSDKAGNYKNRKQIPAEFVKRRFHKKGALSAARTGDHVNPNRMSSWCQFYIVQGKVYPVEQFPANYPSERKKAYTTIGGTPHLDDQYTVFGEVLKGLDIVDKIANVKTEPGDKPIQDVIIISAKAIIMTKAEIKKKYNHVFM